MAGFIVLYDDPQNGLSLPYVWDRDNKGAICLGALREGVAHFESRQRAQRAIRISAAYAKLNKERDEPFNDDFTTGRKHIRIVDLKGEEE